MERYIEVIQNRAKVRIFLKDIYYAEVIRKCCQIHTESAVINTYLTISKLAEQLDSDVFLQCHRSYIVNLNHVKTLRGNEFVLGNGESVLISRPMKSSVQQAYGRFSTQAEPLAEAGATDAQEVKLFFASSDSVLEGDFNELAAFVSSLNSRYARRGVYFSLYVGGEGKRAEDIEAAGQSDIFFLIFKDKPAKLAAEELEAALGAVKIPRIISYHKQTGETPAPRLSIYSSPYTHIDTVKLNIALQLKSLGMENVRIDVDGTSLVLEGKPLMSLDNIPMIFNSKDFSMMKDERATLEKEYWALKEQALKNPEDNEIMTAYARVSEKKNKIEEAIHSLQKGILAMETLFLEKAGVGYISPRLAQARLLYEAGDMEGAKKLLDLDEMEREDDRYDKIHEEIQKTLLAKVSEYLYLADMLKTDISNPGRYTHMERAYGQAVNIEKKFNLDDRTASLKFSAFLFDQRDFEKSVDYARRFLHRYESGHGEAGDIKVAEAYNRITGCYTALFNFEEAEKYSAKATGIIEGLASAEPAQLEPALAMNLFNRGRILYDMARYGEAGEALDKSLEIYGRLAEANPVYEKELAGVCEMLAMVNTIIKEYDKSEDFYNKAAALHEGYKFGDPVMNEVCLASVLCNQSLIYEYTRRYTESEALLLKALAIHERLVYINPAVIEDSLSLVYYNLAILYRKTERPAESEAMGNKAIAIQERLAAEKQAANEWKLEICLIGQAISMDKFKRYDEAEALFKRVIMLLEKQHGENAQAGGFHLSAAFHGLAGVYKTTGRYDEARHFYEKAINIREQLAEKSPAAFESYLAESRKGLADLMNPA